MKMNLTPSVRALLLCLPALACGAQELRLKLDLGEDLAPAALPEPGSTAPALPPFAALPPTSCCAGDMTLADAVRIAVGQHPSISSSSSNVALQAGLVAGARAATYPVITAGINSGITAGNLTRDHGSQVASVGASVTLYDFGKVASRIEQAEALERKQHALLPKQMDAVAQQAADAVVGLHRHQALMQIADEQIGAIGRVLELAQLRATAGLSTQSDPIQARSRLEAAQLTLLQYKAQLAQARERLRTLLGAAAPERVADMPAGLWQDARVEAVPDLSTLPDVIAAEADHAAAVAGLRNAKAQAMPTVSLEGSMNQALGGSIAGARIGTSGRDRYVNVALTVSSTLYQGGAQTAAISSAVAAVDSARAQTDVARLGAGDQIRMLREQILGVQSRLSPLGQRSRTITQTRELYQEQYKLGTRSVLDLLSAEQEIFQSRSDEENARHDLWQSLVGFITATGSARRVFGLDVPIAPPSPPNGFFLR